MSGSNKLFFAKTGSKNSTVCAFHTAHKNDFKNFNYIKSFICWHTSKKYASFFQTISDTNC